MSSEIDQSGNVSAAPAEMTGETASEMQAEAGVDAQTGTLQTEVGAQVEGALRDETVKVPEKIDLGIDWDSLDKEAIFKSMEHYDRAEDICKPDSKRHVEAYIIHTAKLKTKTGETLELNFSKVLSMYEGKVRDELQINLTRPSAGPISGSTYHIASFDFFCDRAIQKPDSEEWDMKHRQTEKMYRNQRIGGKILELSEEIFRQRKVQNGKEQFISARSGQRDLTFWLRDRGFTADSTEDVDKMKRLQAGGVGLEEVPIHGEPYIFDSAYFHAKFDGEVSGPADPAVADHDNYKKPFYYMKSCFKIKMKKGI